MNQKIHSIDEALDFLYHSRPHGQVKLGLDRIQHLLELLGNPHQEYKTIHIAGTNGKGSTARIMGTLLQTVHSRVGTNFSPHLVQFSERIRLNGDMISDADITQTLNAILPAIQRMDRMEEEMRPSFFEIITAMAFFWFAQKDVQVAVMEVGLGGRFDATNVILPEVSIITSIGKDHMQTLGDTLSKIAFEKAGIIKPKRPVVCGAKPLEAVQMIQKRAEEMDSPCFFLGKDFRCIPEQLSVNHNQFLYESNGLLPNDLTSVPYTLCLNGINQMENASLAITAFCIYCDRNDIPWTPTDLVKPLSQISWEGRFELLSKNPPIIVDGAHNEPGVIELVKNWDLYFRGQSCCLLTGILSDKDTVHMSQTLQKIANFVVVTAPKAPRPSNPRAAYDCFLPFFSPDRCLYEEDIEKALDIALTHTSSNCPLLICGSLYLVGYVRNYTISRLMNSAQ